MRFAPFPKLLWDLLPARRRPAEPTCEPVPPTRGGRTSKQQVRYDRLVEEMKRPHRLRVRKWRSSTSGCAWEVHYGDGGVSRLIEAPYPRGPMSCAVFLHEVGHHAIGLHRYRPRCLEEFHAWRWSLEEMHQRGFNVTDRVLRRRDEALRYAVAKAIRRGLRRLPSELLEWAPADVRIPMLQAKTSSSEPTLV